MTSTNVRPPHLPAVDEARLDALLGEMTVAEQVSLLSGADLWSTPAVPRLGIPALKVSDGPAGVRGAGSFVGSKKTAAFPVGVSLASTWNAPLLHEVGTALAREARAKGAAVLLAPTLNVFRHALNGRNFENYSEDPFHTGTLGVAYVQGLQSGGVAATVKHFAGNESEFERSSINSVIDERTLRELYLRPFEMTVKTGGTWAVMTSYNRLNGPFTSDHTRLLQGILRGEWGYDGLVMSDWGGTHTAGHSVRAGLDLEMPGPAKARAGLLDEALTDEETRLAVQAAARNVLKLMARTGILDAGLDVSLDAEGEDEALDTRALIRRAGAEGTVLLKNDGLLPLPLHARVAVIGPNARDARVMGGGSAQMNAHRRVSPLEGLQSALGEHQVTFARGCDNDRFLPVLDVALETRYTALGGGAELFSDLHLGGERVWGTPPAGVPAQFRATLDGQLSVDEGGEYELSLLSTGRCRLRVDGQVVLSLWDDWAPGDTYFGFGSAERRVRLTLTPGQHAVSADFETVDYDNGVAAFRAIRIGFRQPLPLGSVAEAAAVAAAAEYAVVCVGTNGDWETEGVDRPGVTLPGRQDELVRAVRAANPRTVVLLQTGGPVLMPWLPEVGAVLQGWFPGQEAGHAFADVLMGRVDPGGRLPQTFPARLADDPTHPQTPDVQYPGADGRVEYREGLFTGYRHADRAGLTPLFPFGFGLSYTTFELGVAQVSAPGVQPGDTFSVTVPVHNTGTRDGQTVVQLYVRDRESVLERPDKELKAFAKVQLKAGETQDVTLPLDMRSLAYFDPGRRAWVADAGEFELLIGQSSTDLPLTLTLTLAGEWSEAAQG